LRRSDTSGAGRAARGDDRHRRPLRLHVRGRQTHLRDRFGRPPAGFRRSPRATAGCGLPLLTMALPSLVERRFIVLSGKGGVGRTTAAAALARAAVRSGRRVLLAQMDAPARLGRLLGHPGVIGPEVVSVAQGLDAVNMTPQSALHQYGLMVLRYE